MQRKAGKSWAGRAEEFAAWAALTKWGGGVWGHSLHSVHDEDKPFELELAWICEASGRRFQRVPADMAAAAEAAAKSALEDSDM